MGDAKNYYESIGDALVTAGTLGMNKVYENMKENRRDMKNTINAENRELERKIEQKKAEELQMSTDAALRARRRIQSRSSKADFNRGTILTSPIGVINEPQSSGKTLLGA